MKKFLLTLALVGISFASFAQGTLFLNNKAAGVDAKVSYASSGLGAGAGITAQLAIVGAGGSLTLLSPTTTFQSSTASRSFYLNGINLTVNEVAPGASATFRLLAFSTAAGSYAAAKADNTGTLWFGSSNDFTVVTGGAGTPALPPNNLVGMTGFTLDTNAVPEPTTLALLGLGGLALAIRRRK